MLVSGLRQRLARTICQHPLTCSSKSPKRLLTQKVAIIGICKNSTLSSLSPPPLLSVVFFCLAFSPPQAVPVDALAHMCFSLSSIYFSVFALSISLSTHLCLLFRPLSLNVLSLLLLVSLAVCLSSLSSVALCSLSSPSLFSLSLFSLAPSLSPLPSSCF